MNDILQDIKKWKFNYYPWLKLRRTQKVIVWHQGQSLGKSEEVIKSEHTLTRLG